MITGIFAGITWAIETVVLGLALSMSPFVSTSQAMFLAPFVATFLHDAFSALYMFLYNSIKGNLRHLLKVFKNDQTFHKSDVYCASDRRCDRH